MANTDSNWRTGSRGGSNDVWSRVYTKNYSGKKKWSNDGKGWRGNNEPYNINDPQNNECNRNRQNEWKSTNEIGNKNPYGINLKFMIGLKGFEDVHLGVCPKCEGFGHCEIIAFPETDLKQKFSNIEGLRQSLEQALTALKNTGQPTNIMIHQGVMHYQKNPGVHSVQALLKRNNFFERFFHDSINFDFINSLPKVRRILRFDLAIETPDPSVKLFYKMFVHPDEKSFISEIENVDIRMANYVVDIPMENGFFFRRDRDICRIDLVNPSSNFSTRIKLSFSSSDMGFLKEKMNLHVKVLKELFFNEIRIIEDEHGLSINALELSLPDGYELTYLRRVTRNDYDFSGNLVRTSDEKVFCNTEEQSNRQNRRIATDATDVFFTSNKLQNLLCTDWSVCDMLEAIESELEFQDTLMELLV